MMILHPREILKLRDTCAIDQYVYNCFLGQLRAEFGGGPERRGGYIADYGGMLRSGRFKMLGWERGEGFGEGGGVAGEEGAAVGIAGEEASDGEADATAAAGYEDVFCGGHGVGGEIEESGDKIREVTCRGLLSRPQLDGS